MIRLTLISRASALGVLASIAMLWAVADAQAGQYSNTCTNPNAQVVDGWVNSAYAAVRIQQNPADPAETWVCYRVVGASTDLGGRVDIDQGTTQVTVPTVDANYRECSEAPGNAVPGQHPLLEGSLGHPLTGAPIPYLVDTFSTSGSAWVCFRYDVFLVRAVVRPPSVEVPSVRHNTDDATVPDPAAKPLTPGLASSACSTDPSRHRLTNIGAGPAHLHLWVSQPSADQVRVCARAEGPVSAGGALLVDSTVSPGVDPEPFVSDDVSPCTFLIAEGVSPVQYRVARSPGTSLPASVCVSSGSIAKRVTVRVPSVSPVLPFVSWTPDPGTPGLP